MENQTKEETPQEIENRREGGHSDTPTPQITSQTAKELDETKEIENQKKIEAALFLSARYLSLNELVLLTDINPLMLKELIENLIQKYNAEDTAIEIISKENMWKMNVKPEYVNMVNKLATGSSEFTKAEQETLAVIAYKQPVKQSVIINIRGNKAYDHIKRFTEMDLVKAKRMGHTKELRLSDEFYDYFHLEKGGKQLVPNSEEISQEEPESDIPEPSKELEEEPFLKQEQPQQENPTPKELP